MPIALAVVLPATMAMAAPVEPDFTEVDTTDSRSDATVAQAVLDEIDEQGVADIWVVFEDKADLSKADEIDDWAERGTYVYDQLTSTAQASQAELVKLLAAQGVDYEPYWISNTVLIRDADPLTLNAASTQAEVAEIRADEAYELPDPIDEVADDGARVNAVEWGIANIRADQVWGEFGVRGDGIVIGSIDTGVQFDHPALVEQYRGSNGEGDVDHEYNWWDPSNVCGSPSLEPCDNNGHGTHTVGTMVGGDGAGNQVGVAPGAQWIAAKGCETNTCSNAALLSSGQFMLAPTDLSGENPRPELRPNIVNNSWGDANGSGVDPFYRDIVTGWTTAGIFGVFGNGNDGRSGCDTTGSPADYVESWAVGAYDSNNTIADFSSRGPGEDGEIRPSISAPGVNVRSSYPGDLYATASGTSMAAPHQSGAVALMLSTAPAQIGDIGGIRQILASTAIDTEDLSCGGEPGNNNVYGEGRLDAYAAVEASPTGPTGSLTGTVTDATTDAPIANAKVNLDVNGLPRSTRSGADGVYAFQVIPTGAYQVTAEAFGYVARTEPAEVAENEASARDFALDPMPSHPVSGTVTDDQGNPPLAGATVAIEGTPIPPATIDENGRFRFDVVPEGSYTMSVEADGCLTEVSVELVVDGPVAQDVQLEQRADDFGHTCRVEPADWAEATNPLPPFPPHLFPGFPGPLEVELPFGFPFYDSAYTDSVYVAHTGFVSFVDVPTQLTGSPIPANPIPDTRDHEPNAAIYPFGADVLGSSFESGDAQMFTELLGEDGNRQFVIEWRNASICDRLTTGECSSTGLIDFQVVLHESGEIVLQYRNIDPDNTLERGDTAVVGIENADGTDALQFSFRQPTLSDSLAIRYTPPPVGVLSGTFVDANDDAAISGGLVTATNGEIVRTAEANNDGVYAMLLTPGTWTVEFTSPRYVSETREVVIEIGSSSLDAALRTAAVTAEPDAIETSLTVGEQRTFDASITNPGSTALDWQVLEVPGQWSHAPGEPSAPGDVLNSWPVEGEFAQGPNGIAYADGKVWVSLAAGLSEGVAKEYTADGVATGREFALGDRGEGILLSSTALMVFDSRGMLCLSGNVEHDVERAWAIICVDPETGDVVDYLIPRADAVSGSAAYNPDDDIFYISSLFGEGLYQVAGFSHPEPGRILSHCRPDVPGRQLFTDLAYNRATNTLWRTMGADTHLLQLDPDTCAILSTLETEIPYPTTGSAHAGVKGISIDEGGNLWLSTTNGWPPRDPGVYLVSSGLPEARDVPWLEVDPATDSLVPDGSQALEVTVDTTSLELEPGIHAAELVIASNAGRDPRLTIPIQVEVHPDGEDEIPPAVSASLDGERVWESGVGYVYPGRPDAVTVTLSARDNYEGSEIAGIDYRLGDGDWTEYTEPFTVSDPDEHVLAYRATDNAGNISEDQSTAFTIAAGKLDVDSNVMDVTVPLGESVQHTMTLTNTGNRPLNLLGLIEEGDGLTGASSEPDSAQAPPAQPASSEASWVNLPDLPKNVHNNSAAMIGGKLYSFGGYGDRESGTAPFADVYMLDTAGEVVWERLADMPEPRSAAAATAGVIDGKIYLAGGNTEAGRDDALWIYDPATDSWSTGADMPKAVSTPGSAVLDGKLYIVGGNDGSGAVRDVVRYDPASDSWESVADYPEPIRWQSCGGIDNRLYCAGGWTDGVGGSVHTYAYDPGVDAWERKSDIPPGEEEAWWQSAHTAANGFLLISGGRGGYAYDPAADDWTELAAPHDPAYRGGSACGFYRVGGAVTQVDDTRAVEVLPGFHRCGPDPVPWLDVTPDSAQLDAGESVEATVTLDASAVAEPGTYAAEIILSKDAPYPVEPITVTMTVEAAPVTFDDLRESVEAFESDGEVTMAGAKRLLTALDQSERHHDRGADDRAIAVLERFQDTAGDSKFVPGKAARAALVADAGRLIKQLRDGDGETSPAERAPVPGLQPVPV